MPDHRVDSQALTGEKASTSPRVEALSLSIAFSKWWPLPLAIA